ncbi:MAG: ThuA domain-containing protein [Planctomycetes bacterium]|nr:ThuA domain-containing protein [Planctomycetota bacterium]
MTLARVLTLFALLLFACGGFAQDRSAVPVLMLGDNGHHRPKELAKVLAQPMHKAGFEITYTDNERDLTRENLQKYGALLFYLNTDVLPAECEAPLMEYVEKGGALVVLHCACSCFKNSERYTTLVGGRFLSHGAEVFRAQIVDATHPAMRGFAGFESWDETYRHTQVGRDIRILMARQDGAKMEPWTWVRHQGKGRMFYTASGHDERTWNVAGFQDLVARGLKWTTGQLRDEAPAIQHEPFVMTNEYHRGEITLQVPKPLAPADSMKHMHVPEGFRVELFAAEPDIVKPCAMAWDERGRLWVCESLDYPHEVLPPGTAGRDRITICEDSDGDGRADKFTRFAEGLNMPQGIAIVGDGCVVAHAPDIVWMRDRDGDGKCDERKVLYTGFQRGDTHAMHGQFRYGLDGWIWGICGYSGLQVQSNGRLHRSGQCIFRFRADRDEFEVLTNTSNNTWGLGIAEDGEVFASTANGSHSVFLGAPNRVLETVRGWHASGNATVEDHTDAHPVTDEIIQVDFNGGYTAACDHQFYDSGRWPKEWRGRSFVTEPTMHVVHVDLHSAAGSGYVSHDGFNLMASSDPWTAPVQAAVGPDGNVWFLDWYNPIVQHNPWGGYREGPGNAHRNPLRDKSHGRIYRVVYEGKDAELSSTPKLAGASTTELVNALWRRDAFWRRHAQRLLIERGAVEAADALQMLAADGLAGKAPEYAALHALWTLKNLDKLEGGALALLEAGLAHKSEAIRKNAIDLLPRDRQGLRRLLAAKPLDDPSLGVRRHALLALAEMPSDAGAARAILDLLRQPATAQDRWLPTCAIPAAARNGAEFLAAALSQTTPAEMAAVGAKSELLTNGSIEQGASNAPTGWAPVSYSGKVTFRTEPGRSGTALCIESATGADASWSYRVAVEPHTEYRLTGWVRTRDIEVGTGMGALVNIHEFQGPRVTTNTVKGTSDWTPIEVTFESGDHREIHVNALLGGWGQSKGTAWWDDLSLRPIGKTGGESGVVRAVALHVARGGDAAELRALLGALAGAEPRAAAAVLGALGEVKNDRIDDGLRAALLSFGEACPESLLPTLVATAQRWGVKGPDLARASARVVSALQLKIQEHALDADERAEAVDRLLAAAPTRESAELVLAKLDGRIAPDLATRWLRALSSAAAPGTAELALARWEALTPKLRTAVIELLLRKEEWCRALVEAVEAGKLTRADLDPDQTARALARRDPQWRERAERAFATRAAAASSDEKAKLITEKLTLLSKSGDPVRGREAFRNSCVTCHAIGGAGGKVGPDLAGIHDGKREDIVMHLVDPNRVVEANYRRWFVWTKQGDVITGRLLAETKSAYELLDSTGQSRVVPRSDVDEIRTDSLSLMPEGFERLPDEEFLDVVDFLASTKKAPPK